MMKKSTIVIFLILLAVAMFMFFKLMSNYSADRTQTRVEAINDYFGVENPDWESLYGYYTVS